MAYATAEQRYATEECRPMTAAPVDKLVALFIAGVLAMVAGQCVGEATMADNRSDREQIEETTP